MAGAALWRRAGWWSSATSSATTGRFPAAWFSPDGAFVGTGGPGHHRRGGLRGVAATEFGFVAVGHYQDEQGASRPLLLLSGDGRTWARDPGAAFELQDVRRLGLVAVGVHEGMVIVGGLAAYYDDFEELLIWGGPVGPSGG